MTTSHNNYATFYYCTLVKIYECDSSGEKTCWDGHRGDITCMDCQDSDLSS